MKKKLPDSTSIVATTSAATAAAKSTSPRKGQRGHATPLPVPDGLSGFKRLRVGHLMNLLAISHATLYARLQTGSIPKPDGKDGKRPYWTTATIRAFLAG